MSGDSRSTVKRQAILDAATTLFLRDGYLATSMDEIAGLAVVAKQTVYTQFGDKENLFREVVTAVVDEAATPVFAEVSILPDGGDLESDLRDLASRLLARVIQPRLLQLRRLVISEAGRFPELGSPLLRAWPGPDHRRARRCVRASCCRWDTANRGSAAGSRTLQLARHVDSDQPGDALWR